MINKRWLSVSAIVVCTILMCVVGTNCKQKTINSAEEEKVAEKEQGEAQEEVLQPIQINDAIDITLEPIESSNQQQIKTQFTICEATVSMMLPRRFWQQKEFTSENAHITEYEALDGTLMARERLGFKNDTCHFNIYVVGHVSDENMELLSQQTEEEIQQELLQQSGLSVDTDGYYSWEQNDQKQIFGIAYQDDTVDFTKYYFRYVNFESKDIVFLSIGLANPNDDEVSYMEESIDTVEVQTKDFDAMMEEAKNDEVHALYYCGRCYVYGYGVEQNYEQGFQLLLKAANIGNASSQNYVGYAYLNGNGVEADATEAVKWFTLAAEAGNGEAMNNLGNRYYDGNGVEQNYETAVSWYQQAIEAGNTTAYYNLANRYRYGDGIKQDKEMAINYYEKAAEAGIVQAYTRLANMYYDGEGVNQDTEKALQYFQIAAKAGDQIAIDKLSQIQ